MTFEETMQGWFPTGFENYEGNLGEDDLKEMWNAAIKAAIVALDTATTAAQLKPDVYPTEMGGSYFASLKS